MLRESHFVNGMWLFFWRTFPKQQTALSFKSTLVAWRASYLVGFFHNLMEGWMVRMQKSTTMAGGGERRVGGRGGGVGVTHRQTGSQCRSR